MKNIYPFDAVIFDLDGVITKTALVHSHAWKAMFDSYLKERESRFNESFIEFTHENDYLPYVDGKPRYQGVQSFLQSRNINIPFGDAENDPKLETVCALGNRKNFFFNEILEKEGVEAYPSTVSLIHELIEKGIKVGVASSSKNCKVVLTASKLIQLFETRVDGEVSAEIGLKGKPEPDIFTTAADNLGVSYDRTVIVEDAISGVQAGKKGNFGLVLGIAREENTQELLANGADIVVEDIAEIGFKGIVDWFENGLEQDNWSLTYYDYDTKKERSRESLLTVGNGYFGTRGAMEETFDNQINYPGTYLAGLYNSLVSKVATKDIENEDFVNATNWLPFSFKINNDEFMDINTTKIISVKRNLDFRSGLLRRELIVEDHKNRITKVVSYRFASMSDENLAAMEYTVEPMNYSGVITIETSLTATHLNAGDAGDHGLVPEGFGPPQQLAEHQLAQPLAMAVVVDEDRVLHRRGPALAGVIGRKGAPADHFAFDFDDEGGVGGGAGPQPGQPALVGFLRQVPGAGAGPDVVVINGVDRPDVGREGVSDAWFHGDSDSPDETLNKHRKSR